MDARPRIVLDEDDFAEPSSQPVARPGDAAFPPQAQTQAPQHECQPIERPASTTPSDAAPVQPAPALPLVNRGAPLRLGADTASIGPTPMAGRWLTSPSTAPLIAAAVGVGLAWAITEVTGIAGIQPTSKLGSDASAALWTGVVGAVFGGVVLAFDSAVGGAWNAVGKRLASSSLPMFGATFIAGFAANALYLQIFQSALENALRSGGGLSGNNAGFYLARGVGWALFGAGVGTTIGLLVRSSKRALNGGLGGALGGAAGGLLFQFVAVNLGTGTSISRLVGLVGIGTLIALATRMIETSRREAWLQVLAGGMAGKEFILYHAVTRLGSSPDCEIFLLKDPSVEKLHAEIQDDGARRILTAAPGATVLVNEAHAVRQVLRHGDRLQLGGTVIGYSERTPARMGTA